MKTPATTMNVHGAARAWQRGLSLIELMVALTIGAVLIFGATQVYVNSRKSYGVNESVARLQETARYAMSVIEPDIRMSNYWGLLKGADAIAGQAAQTAALAPMASGAAVNICGNNFAADLNTNIWADNNSYVLSVGTPRPAGCDTLNDINTGAVWTTNAMQGSDTITVRRASALFPAAPTAGVLQVCTTRSTGRLISDGSACNGVGQQLSNLIVNAYYIDRNSAQAANLPSLRRKTLTTVGGAPAFVDQEIIPGVEDLQVQFGIDPTGASSSPTGVATRYVDPGAVPANAQIVAVRIWLLVRADTGETGFTDNRIYQYGDRLQATGVTGDLNSPAGRGMAYQPSLNADASFTGPQHVRRLLISRTIQLRNAMGT
jgi:type IV pilus assembly protein PilW